jgi:YHS domain-containing protein
MNKWILIATSVVVVLVGTFMVVKKVSPVGWGWWGEYNTSSGLALKGYDPVAYFNDMKPVEGSGKYVYEWNGATWLFASAENRELFAGDPETFAAQFGGFCSFAVSKGFTADISPDAWHIENGILYVFADQNVRDDWVATIDEGSLEASTTNWAKR